MLNGTLVMRAWRVPGLLIYIFQVCRVENLNCPTKHHEGGWGEKLLRLLILDIGTRWG